MEMRRGALAAALLMALPMTFSASAAAGDTKVTPTTRAKVVTTASAMPTASAAPSPVPSAAPLDPLKAYKLAVEQREDAKHDINDAFIKAVRVAKAVYTDAKARATTAAAKSAAAAAYAQAVADATRVRQEAIDALPPLPPNPLAKPTTSATTK